ncbi:MAG: hypothetical protein ABR910_17720 [Acidobacteriaceae bacterium]|jgi:hypothetical protein
MAVKQVVYRYNGVAASDEVEIDHYGEMLTPNDGQLITRKGKLWKVISVMTQTSGDGSVPVERVFLMDKL